MKITFYGHACFLIETNGHKLLVDPFISGNDLAKDIDIEAIEADFILLTHAHQDHVLDVEKISKNNDDPMVISNFEVASHFEDKGLTTHGMNHGGKYQFDFGTLKYVQAVHTSSFSDGSYGGQPGGFVLWNDEDCLYIAGDTALTMDMKLIPQTCPALDLAILPIGDNFTMGYEDAAIAADFVQCDRVMGVHYDTFPPIKIDKAAAKSVFEDAEKELLLFSIGESRTL